MLDAIAVDWKGNLVSIIALESCNPTDSESSAVTTENLEKQGNAAINPEFCSPDSVRLFTSTVPELRNDFSAQLKPCVA